MRICGHRVLVKPDGGEQMSDGGIYLATDEQMKLDKCMIQKGVVIDYGPTAWKDPGLGDGSPWAERGEYCLFSKHAGKRVIDPKTGAELLLIQDEDIQVVFDKEVN